jgi:membrane-bound serine protease (ClpP class)
MGFVGILCLYFEFFLPGGILALCAVFFMLIGAFLFFWQSPAIWISALYLVFLILLSVMTCLLALKMIRRSKNSFCLKDDQEGYVSTALEDELVGKEGIVSTELKPAGHVRIEGKLYQALSQGDFIMKGKEVVVVSTRGSHVIVKVKNKE